MSQDGERESGAINVVGAGATGSRVVMALARAGVGDPLNVYDFDKVERKNLLNQPHYQLKHIGLPKTTALWMIGREFEAQINPILEKIEYHRAMGFEGMVVVLTDTAFSRKQIWRGVSSRPYCKFLVDGRMGPNGAHVWAVDMSNEAHKAIYQRSVDAIQDLEGDAPVCGGRFPINDTADIVSGLVQMQIKRWLQGEEFSPEVMLELKPMGLILEKEYEAKAAGSR